MSAARTVAKLWPDMASASVSRPPCTPDTRECDWMNWGPRALRPACCTQHLLELIGFTSDLLTRHGIVHWLDYGTLLGAVREGQLIPWDGDADFSILQRDEHAVLALDEEFAAAGHYVERPGLWRGHRGVIRIRYSKVNRGHLDLFMWQLHDGMLQPLEGSEEAWPGMASRVTFPERFITPLGEVPLNGRSFPAPKSVEEFLREHRYGPRWETPAPPVKSVKYYPRSRACSNASRPTSSGWRRWPAKRVAYTAARANCGRSRGFRSLLTPAASPRCLRRAPGSRRRRPSKASRGLWPCSSRQSRSSSTPRLHWRSAEQGGDSGASARCSWPVRSVARIGRPSPSAWIPGSTPPRTVPSVGCAAQSCGEWPRIAQGVGGLARLRR